MPFTGGNASATLKPLGGVGGMAIECQLVEHEEIFERQEAGRRRGDLDAFVEPGMTWFLPMIWDHQDPDLEQYLPALIKQTEKLKDRQTSLSLHYLTQWAGIRDPLCIMLPCHQLFYPDSSPPGTQGWRVRGPVPIITVDRSVRYKEYSYSIVDGIIETRGYHG